LRIIVVFKDFDLSKHNEQWSPPTWVLSLGAGLAPFAVTLVAPAIPAMAIDLKADSNIAQLVLTTLLLSIAVGQLVAGPLSDRFGRKPLFLGGAIAYCVAGFGAVLSDTIEGIIFFRVIQGLGAAAAVAMSRSIVVDFYGRERAAGVMSTIIAMMAIIPVFGTSLGGILTDLVGWHGSFFMLALTGLILTIFVGTQIQETHKPEHVFTFRDAMMGYRELLATKRFLASALTTAFQTAVFFAMMGFIAYSFERMSISPKEFGVWMATTSVGYVIGNLANKRLLKRYPIEIITLVGAIASLTCLLLMEIWHNASPNSPTGLAIPMLLVGLSNGVIIANSIIMASSAIPRLRGSATGLVGAMQMGAGGISGTVAIWLGADQNTHIGIFTLLVISLCSLMAAWWSSRLHQSQ
jgi:DHA1 family bicyclomycin/chloramphenicol resistance-like MFS transporter